MKQIYKDNIDALVEFVNRPRSLAFFEEFKITDLDHIKFHKDDNDEVNRFLGDELHNVFKEWESRYAAEDLVNDLDALSKLRDSHYFNVLAKELKVDRFMFSASPTSGGIVVYTLKDRSRINRWLAEFAQSKLFSHDAIEFNDIFYIRKRYGKFSAKHGLRTDEQERELFNTSYRITESSTSAEIFDRVTNKQSDAG